ncbi:MAG: hypothetical protein NTU90_01025 [Proteobacteria bacterium]|nr:hypothetical protein [Pseudomonadota bacterium]
MGIVDDIKTLGEEIVASYDVRVKALGELSADTRKTLKGFAGDRKKMASEQAESLGNFTKDLAENVDDMLKGFRREHKDMADNLKEGLEKGETERLKDFKNMMGGIRKNIKDIETYVKNKLKEFDDAHADMSEELKKELAKYVAGIVSETKKLLGGFANEREEMAGNWQHLVATMAKKRGGKTEVPVVSGKKVVKKKKEEIEEEAEEASPEEKVLRFIEKHPKGVKVGSMEKPLGMHRMKLGKIAKELLKDGQVKKEAGLYFPL